MRLLLASASARRADLLRHAGFDFVVEPQEVDESVRLGETPAAYVQRLACEKVRAACRKFGAPVVGADTVVVVDGAILGKPADAHEATQMLERLSGREHDVLTGVAVGYLGRVVWEVDRTQVRFLRLSPAEIAWYVATGEPAGKAGAYAIQGRASRFIERIDGSYSNVVGLPMARVYRLLRSLGVGETLDGGGEGAAGMTRSDPD